MTKDIGDILVTAAISSAVSVTLAVIVKVSIERKFAEAAATAAARKKGRIQFNQAIMTWIWAAGRVLYHVVRHVQGRKAANGDLDESYQKLEAVECELRGIERAYTAEAQEE